VALERRAADLPRGVRRHGCGRPGGRAAAGTHVAAAQATTGRVGRFDSAQACSSQTPPGERPPVAAPASPTPPKPAVPGNPELGRLIRDVARMKLTGAEKVKLLEQGSGKIAGVVFKRVTGFPGVAGVFEGMPPSSGGPPQILVVLENGRIFKGPATAIRTGPSGTKGIFIGELKEVL